MPSRIFLLLAALHAGCGAPDADFDGVPANLDCNDTLAAVRPGASELCDGLDNDCDGNLDEGDFALLEFHRDRDGDGFGDAGQVLFACAPPEGWVSQSGDCDDTSAQLHPANPEICDGLDNDCDGQTDEPGAIGERQMFIDLDGDGWGSSEVTEACEQSEGLVGRSGDCDDYQAGVNPDADEVCDEDDNDCDGATDEDPVDAATRYIDQDGDGHGATWLSIRSCTPVEGYVDSPYDCDDLDVQVHPDHIERCDDLDNDCDGSVDEDDPIPAPLWYADTDEDGYGDDSAEGIESCAPIAGRSETGGDCNDADPSVHPGALEPCGGQDLNCDGGVAPYCESCLEIREAGLASGSGQYVVDPDGSSLDYPPQYVYCDMVSDGGGWTLVQRTVWDWTETSQLRTNYARWRYDIIGSIESDRAYRLPGQLWERLAVSGDHMMMYLLVTEEGPPCSPLFYTASGAFLEVTDTGATLTPHESEANVFDRLELTASDIGPVQDCVNNDNMANVPWFLHTCCETCPSIKGQHWSDEPHPSVGYSWRQDLNDRTRTQVCSGLTPIRSDAGSKFGVQVMEYFVR